MWTLFVKISLFFHKSCKTVIVAYHVKDTKNSINMNLYFCNVLVHVKIINAVRDFFLTPLVRSTW